MLATTVWNSLMKLVAFDSIDGLLVYDSLINSFTNEEHFLNASFVSYEA